MVHLRGRCVFCISRQFYWYGFEWHMSSRCLSCWVNTPDQVTYHTGLIVDVLDPLGKLKMPDCRRVCDRQIGSIICDSRRGWPRRSLPLAIAKLTNRSEAPNLNSSLPAVSKNQPLDVAPRMSILTLNRAPLPTSWVNWQLIICELSDAHRHILSLHTI